MKEKIITDIENFLATHYPAKPEPCAWPGCSRQAVEGHQEIDAKGKKYTEWYCHAHGKARSRMA